MARRCLALKFVFFRADYKHEKISQPGTVEYRTGLLTKAGPGRLLKTQNPQKPGT